MSIRELIDDWDLQKTKCISDSHAESYEDEAVRKLVTGGAEAESITIPLCVLASLLGYRERAVGEDAGNSRHAGIFKRRIRQYLGCRIAPGIIMGPAGPAVGEGGPRPRELLDMYEEGMDMKEICDAFPQLTLHEIELGICYAMDPPGPYRPQPDGSPDEPTPTPRSGP